MFPCGSHGDMRLSNENNFEGRYDDESEHENNEYSEEAEARQGDDDDTTLANHESIRQPYFLDLDYFFHDPVVSCYHLKVKQLNILIFDHFAELGERKFQVSKGLQKAGQVVLENHFKVTFTSFVWFSCHN